ncbi:hypothetical protein MUO79_04465 [Candidatus Bathyarchaeota archaeon]|nr:hypothetical protein [Candidatus Bathyarchaeota archaeon]
MPASFFCYMLAKLILQAPILSYNSAADLMTSNLKPHKFRSQILRQQTMTANLKKQTIRIKLKTKKAIEETCRGLLVLAVFSSKSTNKSLRGKELKKR